MKKIKKHIEIETSNNVSGVTGWRKRLPIPYGNLTFVAEKYFNTVRCYQDVHRTPIYKIFCTN